MIEQAGENLPVFIYKVIFCKTSIRINAKSQRREDVLFSLRLCNKNLGTAHNNYGENVCFLLTCKNWTKILIFTLVTSLILINNYFLEVIVYALFITRNGA